MDVIKHQHSAGLIYEVTDCYSGRSHAVRPLSSGETADIDHQGIKKKNTACTSADYHLHFISFKSRVESRVVGITCENYSGT